MLPLTAPTRQSARALSTITSTTSRPTFNLPLRTFSTTPQTCTKTITATQIPDSLIPPYPYGASTYYKQSNRGLYGGATQQHGNNVSEHDNKTPRVWKPNVHLKKFYSESLQCHIKVKMTTRVFRTILKEGGLDNYLLKSKPARVKDLGPGGWKLRWLVMLSKPVRERFAEERKRLGVLDVGEGISDQEAEELVKISLDTATPGPLTAATRKILERRAKDLAEREEFILGGGVPGAAVRDISELEIQQVPANEAPLQETEASEQLSEIPDREYMAMAMGRKVANNTEKEL
jgi:large subunit ribosomal protein L28